MALFRAMPARQRKILSTAKANAGTLDPRAPLDLKFTATLRDHDILGHVTNTRYNELAALSRNAWMVYTGMETGAQTFSVTAEDTTYLKMMRAGMSFTLRTQLEVWDKQTMVFSQSTHIPKHTTSTGICALRLSDGPLSVIGLLGAQGVTDASPAASNMIKPYLV